MRAEQLTVRRVEVLLEVHEDNPRAQAACARFGFVRTGRSRPYPLDPASRGLEMACRSDRRQVRSTLVLGMRQGRRGRRTVGAWTTSRRCRRR